MELKQTLAPGDALSGLGAFLKSKTTGEPVEAYQVVPAKAPAEHVRDLVDRIGPLAFRRPLQPGEAESYASLAHLAIHDDRPWTEIVRVPLRSILSSPSFLLFDNKPGPLDDHALASRLSYFLWRSMPDAELFDLATAGNLSNPDILARQVDRMLDDPKSERFVTDFLGQWLELHDINNTTPDKNLYPEYDELLGQALVRETELFFTELLVRDLGVANLIDADFTFLNRRLATHYGIEGIQGQHFRKVQLPSDSVRGGVLTQASILKLTANGTVTSPVKRGNFVLARLLGQPPDPPPPNVGSIEPDTRGTTTIRETLAAHRDIETCNRCHRVIDPPGFALESFDPIGGFRTRYRATLGGASAAQAFLTGRGYKSGLPVDPSGVTADGTTFSDISDFKRILQAQTDQVARNFIAQADRLLHRRRDPVRRPIRHRRHRRPHPRKRLPRPLHHP